MVDMSVGWYSWTSGIMLEDGCLSGWVVEGWKVLGGILG
jgi:hypothetical protein